MKVEQYYSKNQFHLYGIGIDMLQSYNSLVVKINNNGTITLGEYWNYSNTTAKYVYMFLEEYGNINFGEHQNKGIYIQSLIDNGTIKYDEDMR